MRTYEKLTADSIIYNKRGIGYFVADDARETIISAMRKAFFDNEVPAFARKMWLLGISHDQIQLETYFNK